MNLKTDEKNTRRFARYFSLKHTENPEKSAVYWKSWQKVVSWCAIVSVLCAVFAIWTDTKWKNIIPSHGFTYLGVRPGLVMKQNLLGDIYFDPDGDVSERTVFDEVPSDMTEEEKILLALKLYQIGNLSMVTAPHSGYYSVGTSDSSLLGETLPLYLQTTEIRNNTTGEYYRAKYQIVKPGVELGVMLQIMSASAECAERKYHKVGNEKVLYERTTNLFQNESGQLCGDWSTLAATSAERLAVMTEPVPYTSAGLLTNSGSKPNSVLSGGLFYVDAEGAENAYIPRYFDSANREIGYEKTDQHLCYDLENEKYRSVTEASVEYDASRGVYVVSMTANPETCYYTCAETRWSIADADSTNDPNANYTKIEVKFELWDNGYFKKWEMWEDWLSEKARPAGIAIGTMSAVQYYCEEFTYNAEDCSLDRFDFWSEESGEAQG